MTHNIIHNEIKVEKLAGGFECWDSFYSGLTIEQETEHDTTKLYEKYLQDYMKDALTEYAEHYLIKHIDSEIERLEDVKGGYAYTDFAEDTIELYQKEIEHFQSLKAELTKSK